MELIQVSTLSDLMAERQVLRDAVTAPVWDSVITGLSMIDEIFDQFITQVLPSSGFIWGTSIWGVDSFDSATSDMAATYGLS